MKRNTINLNRIKWDGRKISVFFLSLFILFFLSKELKAQKHNENGFPSILEADLSASATAVYHLQFNSAERHLHHAMLLLPDHPAPYFFMTMLRWYQFTYDSLENKNPVLEKALEYEAERAIQTAKKYVKKNKATGFLYWGGALGSKGWYRVMRGQWVRAYFDGKKGYSLMRKVIEIDPQLYDAYLGIGMYEYYAATLGPALRALASFSIRGDKESALRSLQVAQNMSRYVRLEAAYFLWSGAMDEGRLADAKKIAEVLTQSYPESPLFRWCEIQTLFYQKKWVETILKGEKYREDALKVKGPQQGNFVNPFNLLLAKVYYHCGAAAFNLRHFDRAKFYFSKAMEQHSEFVGWKAMAILRMGELLELEGKRNEAIENYKKVLGLPKVWNSHKLAKERLKKPYQLDRKNGNNFIYSPLQLWISEVK